MKHDKVQLREYQYIFFGMFQKHPGCPIGHRVCVLLPSETPDDLLHSTIGVSEIGEGIAVIKFLHHIEHFGGFFFREEFV